MGQQYYRCVKWLQSRCCTGGTPPCIVDKPGATVFPQGTGFAATFDAPLVFAVGVAVSDESRAMQSHVPNRTVEYRTRLVRDQHRARPAMGMAETYGEDPARRASLPWHSIRACSAFPHSRRAQHGAEDAPCRSALVAYLARKHRFVFDAMVTEEISLTFLPLGSGRSTKALGAVMSAISALNGMLASHTGRC